MGRLALESFSLGARSARYLAKAERAIDAMKLNAADPIVDSWRFVTAVVEWRGWQQVGSPRGQRAEGRLDGLLQRRAAQ